MWCPHPPREQAMVPSHLAFPVSFTLAAPPLLLFTFLVLLFTFLGTGEMAQWARALAL